jgi:molybdenum cofactor cytidylyltransferase
MATEVSETYSRIVLEHFRRPLHRRRLDGATAVAEGSNPLCGDRIRIECRLEDGRIIEAAFSGDACAIGVAAASLLTDHMTGKSIREAMLLSTLDIRAWLEDSVPTTRARCASLPLEAMNQALTPMVQIARARPVILAAGASRRFGGDKLTARVDGEPMLRGIVRAYAALCGQVTVVARSADQFSDVLAELPATVVVNEHADEGIASSIRCGVTACSDRPAVMIALGDEPRIDRTLIATVMDCWADTAAPVVTPRYGTVPGHPVLFDRSVFADLLTLHGDNGAREIVRRLASAVRFIDVDHAPPIDIDRPEDLRSL